MKMTLRKTLRVIIPTIALTGIYLFNGYDTESSRSRNLSVALRDGGCFVLPAQEPGAEVQPVFAASYPGSGARMTWNLIEALTGLVTGDEWYSNGRVKDVVTVKTHHPHNKGRKLPWANEIKRAFVLIRNPMKAIPSYHNFLYEFQNKLGNHSTRAPVAEWIKWRDRSFFEELKVWKNHMEFWLDNYAPKDRIIVPYEHLTHPKEGPIVTAELNEFLGEGPGVTPIPRDSVPCVWGTVVNYKNGKVPNSRKPLPKNIKFVGNYPIFPGSSREGPKERPYTQEHLDALMKTTDELRRKYKHEGGRLLSSLEMYINEIKNASPTPHTPQPIEKKE